MEPVTRRNFVAASLAGAGTAFAAPAMGEVKPALYSITYLGYWYRGDALRMDQLLAKCKAYGYEGLEIEGKRPHGCPLDWPRKRCLEFGKQAADAGIALPAVAGNNDFSSPVPERREAQLVLVKDLVRMTSELGSKILRVFLAWYGGTRLPEGGGRYDIGQKIWDAAHEDFTEDQAWAWCRECFVEAARWAGEHGVTLALQNHRPLLKGYRDVLRMIREVGSPHMKACIDAPLMENRDPAYIRNAVQETGKLQVHSHYGGTFEQEAPGQPIRTVRVRGGWRKKYVHEGYIDDDVNPPFVRALLETGYRGYVGYELCHPLPEVDGKVVGFDYADRQARIAAEYMRGVIAQAKKDLAAGKG